jgi:hypothetical protein
MINLILKDIIIQKKTVLLSLVYMILVIIISSGPVDLGFIAGLIGVTYILITTSSATEDKNNVYVLLNSLPIKRSHIILSKYLSIFVYIIIGTVYYYLAISIINVIGASTEVSYISFQGVVIAIFAVSLLNGIYLPVLFKVGYTKTRILSMILFMSFFFGVSYIIDFFRESENIKVIGSIINFLSNLSSPQVNLVTIGLTIIVLLISYALSLRFYNNREF